MADFERKLTMLAERGIDVGPEEMIERVEAQLAEEPLVVVTKQRKGWAMSVKTDERQDQNKGGSRPGLIWAAAAFVAVIGIGVLYLALSPGGGSDVVQPTPTTTLAPATTTLPAEVRADIAVIDEFLTAWFDGDFARAAAMLGIDPEQEPGQAGWSEYEGAIGADVAVECTPRAEDRVYDCEFSYSNEFYEAVEAAPAVIEWSGRVIDGDSLEFMDLSIGSFLTPVMLTLETWEREVDYESPCDWSVQPIPQCAEFQLEHLDEWAAWYRANN